MLCGIRLNVPPLQVLHKNSTFLPLVVFGLCWCSKKTNKHRSCRVFYLQQSTQHKYFRLGRCSSPLIHLLLVKNTKSGGKMKIKGMASPENNTGDVNYNNKLSTARANSVKQQLLKRELPQARLPL